MIPPEIIPLGEHALIVRLSDSLDAETNSHARAIADAVELAKLTGIVDVVPANSSVGIYMDGSAEPQKTRTAIDKIISELRAPERTTPSRTHEIPVSYDGPDLESVAMQCRLSVQAVIEIHAEREYQVFAIGFAPGFGYLGELDERISVPRRAEPRTRVPAGSVAIANRQTAIYPLDTPGGWNLIGKTVTRIFDIDRESPSLFKVGDRVRFVPS